MGSSRSSPSQRTSRLRLHGCSSTVTGRREGSRHFRANVVGFSRGVVAAQSSQIRAIASCVGGKSDSQRRRLQRFVGQEGTLKGFFKAWTRSIVNALGVKELLLAVDETKLKDKLGLMVV